MGLNLETSLRDKLGCWITFIIVQDLNWKCVYNGAIQIL